MQRFCLLCLFSFLVPGQTTAGENLPWSLEEIFASSKFSMKSLPAVQWTTDQRSFSYLEKDPAGDHQDLYLYDVASGERHLVMDGAVLPVGDSTKGWRIGSYEWSRDGKSILVTGSLPARRVKSGGSFGLFDVGSKTFRLLSEADEEQAIIRLSPDGRRLGFVRSNNLFVMDLESGEEVQLTFDGSETILNGVFDWVYEEEFSIINAWEWSPDGARIAFWRIDQSMVPTFPIVRYPNDAHVRLEVMRYPKAGDPNPVVAIGVADLQARSVTWVDLGTKRDLYVPRIQWTRDPHILAVQRLNRGQDTLDLMLADVRDGSTRVILTETDSAWIDAENGYLEFLGESDRFLWTSNRDGFNHLYLYEMDGTLVGQVTKGGWEVTAVHGADERLGVVYFTAARPSPMERHLYRVRLDGTGSRRITEGSGWHTISFSSDKLAFLDTHSNVSTPPRTSLRSNNGDLVALLVENSAAMFEGYRFGPHKFLEIPTSDGETLNAWMISPPDMDPQRRYPVLLYVYGGPGSQTVVDAWGGSRYLWFQLLASRGYIVVSVDNRGTGARGKTFMQQVHRRLGIREIGDYVETARYLSSLASVDSTRIGIWGWSWGGYAACFAMTYAAGVFSTAIGVGSVTDWKFYDSIYTERYMGTPADNPEGYRITSALTHAAKMEGNLLLIHGAADDNVHLQNVLVFVDQLVSLNKRVTTMFYPERRHSISGKNSTLHVHTLMTEYLLSNL